MFLVATVDALAPPKRGTMNEEYLVHIIGRPDPLPIDYNEYEAIRKALNGESQSRDFHSIVVDGKSRFSFTMNSVAMIEQRTKG